MRVYHAAAVATALTLLLSTTGVTLAAETTDYSVSGPAQGSNVTPNTVVQKKAKTEQMSESLNPKTIGTPTAVGSPGASAEKGTQGGPHATKGQ